MRGIGQMLLLLAAPAFAGDDDTQRPLFSENSTMTVQITAPISDVMRDRDDNKYREGKFRYVDSAGNSEEFDLKIRARGNYRRRESICRFAPLRLNFRKKQVRDTVFDGQDKIKLVTHCDSRRADYEQNLLKEYFAYRIYQQVTDLSFSVRLLHVTYTDTNDGDSSLTKYAFLIEDSEHIAERVGIELSSLQQIDLNDLVPAQTNLAAVFEYLIGNTDFSAVLGAADDACCHNIDLFTDSNGKLLPVPYDFDQAGIVDAPYAGPNPKYPIDEVTDRLYRGLCSNNRLLAGTLDRYRDLEPDIRQMIDLQEGLKPAQRVRMQRFVDKFYDDVSSDRAIENNLLDTCSS
jgi:hypothetical protein